MDFCRDSQVSFTAAQSDVVYTITYTGTGSTPATQVTSPTETITFATVSTDTDITRCPVTTDLQIFDGTDWIDYVGNESLWPWISGYTADTEFSIRTDSHAYGDPSTIFNSRLVANDPDSTSASATAITTFTVTLNSVCATDVFSLDTTLSDLTIQVSASSSNPTINPPAYSSTQPGCPIDFSWWEYTIDGI